VKARRGLLFALVLGLAGGAAGQGVRERAFAWARSTSSVRPPMPRVGRFTTRSNEASSSRFEISRR